MDQTKQIFNAVIDLIKLNDSKLAMNLISREELKEKLDRRKENGHLKLNEYLVLSILLIYDAKKCLAMMTILSYILPIHHALQV
jgi:hypothetical protein